MEETPSFLRTPSIPRTAGAEFLLRGRTCSDEEFERFEEFEGFEGFEGFEVERDTAILPFSGVNLKALPMRLKKTRSSLGRSAMVR
jgi:hypothetical protein